MMAAIIYRSFAEHMGIQWPKDVAYLSSLGRGGELEKVTWAEVMAARRARQKKRLEYIRRPSEAVVVPCYVWAFFNRQDIPYHGWYCYVEARGFDIAVNFRGFEGELAESIMRAMPLGLLPMKENFYKWMERFARECPRARHPKDRRKAGTKVGWLRGRRVFTLERPE